MDTPATTSRLSTSARFTCEPCNIRALIAGEATTVYSTLFILQERHWEHR